jgi:hypothetical protein
MFVDNLSENCFNVFKIELVRVIQKSPKFIFVIPILAERDVLQGVELCVLFDTGSV